MSDLFFAHKWMFWVLGPLFLLWVLGDDLPGAVTVRPVDGEEWPPEAGEPLDEDAVRWRDEKALRFSLAGVQLKFSAVTSSSDGLTIPAKGVGGKAVGGCHQSVAGLHVRQAAAGRATAVEDVDPIQDDEGGAFLFLGGRSGLSFLPDWVGEIDVPNAHFGSSVAGIGDVNADGRGDVIVGAPRISSAFVFLGNVAGLEILHAMAVVVLGGVVSSTLVSLIARSLRFLLALSIAAAAFALAQRWGRPGWRAPGLAVAWTALYAGYAAFRLTVS